MPYANLRRNYKGPYLGDRPGRARAPLHAYASTFSLRARRPLACSRRATFGEPDACFASRKGIMRAMSFLRSVSYTHLTLPTILRV